MKDITYSIVEHIANLSDQEDWNLELNKVSFNQRPAKYDIRCWNADHSRMSKGITLTQEEFDTLKEVLAEL